MSIWKFTVGLFLVLLGLAGIVRGQDDTALLLARVCYSERDAQVNTNDCAAIWETTRNRARLTHRTPRAQLLAYSASATGVVAPRSARHRWIAVLGTTQARSEWDTMNAQRRVRGLRALSWSRLAHTWEQTLTEAQHLLTNPRNVCEIPPSHWGGAAGLDDHNPRIGGWILLDCGHPLLNRFWCDPDESRCPQRIGYSIPASVAAGRR